MGARDVGQLYRRAAADASNEPTPEEADEWMQEVDASNMIPKSSEEIREYLREIEFFLAEKYPSVIPDFIQLIDFL